MVPRWEHFYHEADVGVRGIGTTLEEAFEEAAVALTAVVVEPESINPREMIAVACHAPDRELLLAEWLNALVYEMSTRRMLFRRFRVRVVDSPAGEADGVPATPAAAPAAGSAAPDRESATPAAGLSLHGEAIGEPVDVGGHAPAVEVKGATYTELKVFQDAAGLWVAQCVVDV